MSSKTQWQKRVDVTQFIYSILIKGLNAQEIKDEALNYDLDANQLSLIEYFAANKQDIEQIFSKNLKANWTWERIAYMQQAILYVAYCEVKALKRDIAVAIDQALVTADKYGQVQEKGFLNALLDKVLKDN